jgi:hypothetical protein
MWITNPECQYRMLRFPGGLPVGPVGGAVRRLGLSALSARSLGSGRRRRTLRTWRAAGSGEGESVSRTGQLLFDLAVVAGIGLALPLAIGIAVLKWVTP